jgi:ABC-2 type transport system permease protein
MTVGLRMMLNDTYKLLLLDWHYKFNLLNELVIMGVAFVGLSFLVGGGEFQPDQLPATLLGYLMWFYTMKLITGMSYNLRDEMQTGTLEQMYMSPTPAGLLLLGQSIARLLSTTATTIPLTLALVLLLDIQIPWRPAGLPVFALTVMGLFGFGYLIGGVSLVFKHAQAFADLVQYMMIFLNGALIPVERFPDWLAFLAKLLPATQGIVVLRQAVLGDYSLGQLWAEGSLVWLALHSVVVFLGGWAVFRWCEQIARRQGSLGQY